MDQIAGFPMNEVLLICPNGSEVFAPENYDHFTIFLDDLKVDGFVKGKRLTDYGNDFYILCSYGKIIAASCDGGLGEIFLLDGNGFETNLAEQKDQSGFLSREVLERWFRLRSFE